MLLAEIRHFIEKKFLKKKLALGRQSVYKSTRFENETIVTRQA